MTTPGNKKESPVLNDFHDQACGFLESWSEDLTRAGFQIRPHWDLDHLCYRVPTPQRYQELRVEFEALGTPLTETIVGGRPIRCFQLSRPIEWRDWRIDVLELPAPKAGVSPPKEGFEHAEIVVDIDFHELPPPPPTNKNAQPPKELNAEWTVELAVGSAKFHQLSLASVIRLESQTRIFSALHHSCLLADFRDHRPLLAGTYPLGLATSRSDLDLLFHAADLDALEIRLRQHPAVGVAVRITRGVTDGLDSLTANFEFAGVPFEIFAQDRSAVIQRAYRHFLIEEKILKYAPASFASKIRALRDDGMKTEPAFGVALSLSGDPFETLLEWQTWPVHRLREELRRFYADGEAR